VSRSQQGGRGDVADEISLEIGDATSGGRNGNLDIPGNRFSEEAQRSKKEYVLLVAKT
jgi:hypothetical protein